MPGDITSLLLEVTRQRSGAAEELGELLYAELRRLAASQMRRERREHTLSPTALVNEAWLRFGATIEQGDIRNRQHFFGIAATAMRRVLVEHARARHAAKRGGDSEPVAVENLDDFAAPTDRQLLALDDALSALQAIRPRAAGIVELRFFGGLTHADIATLLNLERRTVDRDWAFARAWLFGQLQRRS